MQCGILKSVLSPKGAPNSTKATAASSRIPNLQAPWCYNAPVCMSHGQNSSYSIVAYCSRLICSISTLQNALYHPPTRSFDHNSTCWCLSSPGSLTKAASRTLHFPWPEWRSRPVLDSSRQAALHLLRAQGCLDTFCCSLRSVPYQG